MPSTNWLTARAEIASILSSVAITAPLAQTMARVYETPPAQANDFPCVIIMGTEKPESDRSAMLRDREYLTTLRLIVEDADLHRAFDIIDAFQEAINTAFDQNVTLNGKVSNIIGPRWAMPGFIDAGGREVRGCDAQVRLLMTDDPGLRTIGGNMVWKYKGDGSNLLGVPPRDLSDEEYDALNKAFKEREGVSIESTGMYEQETPKKEKPNDG